MANGHMTGFSTKVQAILAAARRPPTEDHRPDVTAGAVIGGSYTGWSELTLLLATTPPAHAPADFMVRGYRIIGSNGPEEARSVAVSMPAGAETKIARLSFPPAAVEAGKECYYATFLDFARSAVDSEDIDGALFLVVDDQLTCHVLGGTAAA